MFADEIGEQPAALRDAVAYYQGAEGSAVLDRLAVLHGEAAGRDGAAPVCFTGMGSSLYAAEVAVCRLARGGIDSHCREAGEWLHYGLTERWRGLVIATSQSGESVETRALAERLSGHVPLAAVTNDPESGMARAAGVVLPMRAGREEMISTKTLTNSIGVMLLAAAALLGERAETQAGLTAASMAMEQALDPILEAPIQAAAAWLDEARALHALARGPSLAAARAGALILGEGAHLAVTALPAASYRHGPMELTGPGHVAVVLAPAGPTRPLIDRLVGDLIAGGSRVILLADRRSAERHPGLIELPLPGSAHEAYFSLPATVAIERLLAAVARRRGLTPGQFRFGGKITDRE